MRRCRPDRHVPKRTLAGGERRQNDAMIARILFCAGLSLACVPALAAPFGKTFKDWDAICDNVGDCVAIGYEPNAQRQHGRFLRLDVKAGGAARPTLRGAVEGIDFAKARFAEAPAELAGKPLVEQLLAMARKGETATLTEGGATQAAFSLAGLSAALLAIDEHQGRIGTQAALIRPGPKPASSVPGPKPPPRVVAVSTAKAGKADAGLAKALAAHLGASLTEECDRQDDERGAGEVWRMSASLTLVRLYCNSGAYNFSSRYWLMPGREVQKAQPVRFAVAGGTPSDELVNSEYDPAQGVLTYFSRGRGIGDCGTTGEYVWTGRGFDLARQAEMLTCNGVGGGEDTDIDPGAWPTLWRTRK